MATLGVKGLTPPVCINWRLQSTLSCRLFETL